MRVLFLNNLKGEREAVASIPLFAEVLERSSFWRVEGYINLQPSVP
jgi:hypothetical protein